MIDTQRIIELINLLEAIDPERFPLMAAKAQRRIEYCEVLLKLARSEAPLSYVAYRLAEAQGKKEYVVNSLIMKYEGDVIQDRSLLLEKIKTKKQYKDADDLEHKIKFAYYHMIE